MAQRMMRFKYKLTFVLLLISLHGFVPTIETHAATYPMPPAGEQVIGEIEQVRISSEETLLDIALRYHIGHKEIIDANPDIDPWLPPEGSLVKLPNQHILPDAPYEGIVINLPELRLFYYPPAQPGEQAVVHTYAISIGSEGRDLPTGWSRITEKKVKPSWQVPESIREEHARDGDPLPAVIPPGPDNPLGDYAMRLNNSSYLIHGTNHNYSIGLRVSHGCIRMYPADIEELFPLVPLDTPVRIVNQPFKAGWRADELYVEAHHPLQETEYAPKSGTATEMVSAIINVSNITLDDRSWELSRQAAEQQLGVPARIISAREGENLWRTMAAKAPGLAPGDTWWLQVGAFRNLNNAKSSLESIGDLPIPLSASMVTEGHLCRIIIGPFAERAAAMQLGRVLKDSSALTGFPLHGAELNGYRFCQPQI